MNFAKAGDHNGASLEKKGFFRDTKNCINPDRNLRQAYFPKIIPSLQARLYLRYLLPLEANISSNTPLA